jgi:nitrite reductase/ring-hydroxylating ferredoxin subunit
MEKEELDQETKYTRRRFFVLGAMAVAGAALGGIVGGGLIAYFFPPKRFRKKIGGWQKTRPANECLEGQAVASVYFGIPVLILREGGKVKAFSAVCPHLGCIVKWDAERKIFPCPCHDSFFSAQGLVQKGPARPYNLMPFEAKEEEGMVMVSLPVPEKLKAYPSWYRFAMQYGG